MVDSLGLRVTKDILLPKNLGLEVPWEDLIPSFDGTNALVGILGNILAIRSKMDNVVLSAATVVVVEALVVVVVTVEVVVATVVVGTVVVSEVVIEMVVGTWTGVEVTGLDVVSSVRNSLN